MMESLDVFFSTFSCIRKVICYICFVGLESSLSDGWGKSWHSNFVVF